MKMTVGQIVENILPGAKKPTTIVVRIIELNVAGTNQVRVTDARETRDDAWLIANDRTWAAPLENIRHHDSDCSVCHESGLVAFGAM